MSKYFTLTCGIVLIGLGAKAQSITIAELTKELDAPFATVTNHLKAKQFTVSGSGAMFNGVTTIRFQKKIGESIEDVASFSADTARKIPAGITYSYNRKTYTNGLIGELKRTNFILKRTINEPKRSIAIYQDDKFEATITTYKDANAYTSVTVRHRLN